MKVMKGEKKRKKEKMNEKKRKEKKKKKESKKKNTWIASKLPEKKDFKESSEIEQKFGS